MLDHIALNEVYALLSDQFPICIRNPGVKGNHQVVFVFEASNSVLPKIQATHTTAGPGSAEKQDWFVSSNSGFDFDSTQFFLAEFAI
jgi:hypothetical protein